MFASFSDLAFLGAAAGGGGELWTPAAITTALWLDAADASTITTVSGAVSQWDDKSGSGFNAAQSDATRRPVYNATGFNGNPGLVFDGINDTLTHSLAGPSEWTLICAFKIDALQTGFRGLIALGPPNNSGGCFLASRTDTVDVIGTFTTGTVNSTSTNSAGLMRIAVIEDNNSSSGTKTFYATGTPAGTFTGNPIGQSGHIGGIIGQHSAVTVAEAIVLASVASTDTRQRIEGYLAHKWGLTASLPNDHPYKTTAPTL
jgi:hypothetical protein